jgi:UDP-N-acetylmuramate: L-alanyl-gamma-D-glutamyl-meso-diaminopimelate ligase
MYIHVLGICGTFMAGLALLAREAGHQVSGCDTNVYPPMSIQLAAAGIQIKEGYLPEHLKPAPEDIIVGNVMSRGQPIVELLLNDDLSYTSGPQWLAEHVLRKRWVLAVAGTHGKTTTSSMLAWILDQEGLEPGFLIGGIATNFGASARLGQGACFVVEADEYDTAFFDKRSKFVHYRPRTLVLNNLEFDHADIFPDLAAIQRQFHHLVRLVPEQGLIVSNGADNHLETVLAAGCWTPVERFGDGDWQIRLVTPDGSVFDVYYRGDFQGRVEWSQFGIHNAHNALAAIAAARHVGVSPAKAINSLAGFKGIKRRMEQRGIVNHVTVYDDFAHHPTAIAATLTGLRAKIGNQRIIAVLEPRSNSMRLGIFKDQLAEALASANAVVFYQAPDLSWNLAEVVTALAGRGQLCTSLEATVAVVKTLVQPGDQVIVMSNGSFGEIHERLLAALANSHQKTAVASGTR